MDSVRSVSEVAQRRYTPFRVFTRVLFGPSLPSTCICVSIIVGTEPKTLQKRAVLRVRTMYCTSDSSSDRVHSSYSHADSGYRQHWKLNELSSRYGNLATRACSQARPKLLRRLQGFDSAFHSGHVIAPLAVEPSPRLPPQRTTLRQSRLADQQSAKPGFVFHFSPLSHLRPTSDSTPPALPRKTISIPAPHLHPDVPKGTSGPNRISRVSLPAHRDPAHGEREQKHGTTQNHGCDLREDL